MIPMIDIYKLCAVGLAFNLQMFAEANVQTTASEGLVGDLKTYYHDRLIDYAEPYLVHDQFAMEIPIPEHGGKTLELRVFDVIDKQLRKLVEGVTPDGNNLRMRTITVTVDQYGDYVTLSDVVTVATIDPMILQATKAMGSQAGRTLDTVTREVLTAGTQVMYAPKISGGVETEIASRGELDQDCKITVDLVYQAAAQLKAMLAEKIGGSYVAIIHPYAAYDLMRGAGDQWTEMHKYAATEELFSGEIGRIAGVRFVESTEAKIVKEGKGGLAVYLTMVLGADAYATTKISGLGLEHIFKPLGSGEDQLNQRCSVGWKATKAAIRVKEENMVRIESCGFRSDKVAAN